jgi:serine/threonine protein kinase
MKVCRTCHNFFPDTMEVCPVDFCALEETDDELIGHVIGGCYRIISRLAEGGVGTVYFAKHQFFDRSVAIKVLKPMHLDNKDLRDRTLREARICGNVEHPNIVKVYDMVPQDRNLCVVMEYLQGETLKERLDREGKQDISKVCRIMSMSAEGLARAHSLDIIHRDIKPSNIFLTDYGRKEDFVKLLDFGIAYTSDVDRVTEEGALVGTPRYCSPEQLKGTAPLKASDIYSLGCVIYEILTGRPPFPSESLEEIMKGHLTRDVEPLSSVRPDVPERLSDIVLRMLEKNPDERYQDAAELILTLRDEGFYDIESQKPPPAGVQAETEWEEDTTSINWGAYFEKVELGDGDDPAREESYHRGLESAEELRELGLKAKEIVREMEAIENRRRGHQESIARAIEILGMDLSALRVEYRKNKAEYIKLLTRKDHLGAQIKILKESFSQRPEGKGPSPDVAIAPEELSFLAEAGELARELVELGPRLQEMLDEHEGYKVKMKQTQVQISRLASRLSQIESECGQTYEDLRQRLNEISRKSEALRNMAALAADFVRPARR